jgi:capsular polysaccharide biosynthesis protein
MAKNSKGDNHDLLLAHLGSSAEATNDSWPDNLIILRRGLARDDQDLNLELISSLSEYGFYEVFMDDYSIQSQIELFRHAKRVVSLHGGALTNLIFSKPGTDVLEIFNSIYRNFDYERIAQMRRLNYQSAESSEMSRIKEWARRKS